MWDFDDPAHNFEKLSKRFFGWVLDFDFIGYSPKKSIVYQIFRFQICAKDNQLIEWNLNFFSTADRQVVVTLFEGYDPTVQQFVDAHPLSSKVINKKHSAVAL